jgi:CTP synthase
VKPEAVIAALDASTIYEVPLNLHEQNLDELVVKRLGLKADAADLGQWERIVKTIKNPEHVVRIGIVGKYVDLKESYKSLNEALVHGGIANNSKVELVFIDSENLSVENTAESLKEVHGILVPGGFGERGAEGKIAAIQYARENKIPYFGICFGMQLAVIEFARHVAGVVDATSREFVGNGKGSRSCVIDIMNEQKKVTQKGGTMRLGSYPCSLGEGTIARSVYKKDLIHERHRHRYEFNNRYREILKKYGLTLSGICEDRDLVEIVELKDHPWFLGCQFHPEFKSKPMAPHPLFTSFVEASLHQSLGKRKTNRVVSKAVSAKVIAKNGGKSNKVPKSAKAAQRPAKKLSPTTRKAREFFKIV